MKEILHLVVESIEFGSMVELAVVPPLCAATKLAKIATATVDFANILRVVEFEG